MVTSGSFMPLHAVAAGAAGVKGKPAGRCATLDPGRARSALDLFDQVRAMTWRRLHPRT